MFTVKGLNCNAEFDCINRARFYREKMCKNNCNIFAKIDGNDVILETGKFVVIGKTNQSLRVFNTIEEAIAYKANLMVEYNDPDIYINIGKITPTDIVWLKN